MPYQPRRTLAGFTAEQSASIYHALQELAQEAQTRRDASVAILTDRVDLRANQFARLSPPASGQVAVLPHPLRTSPGDEVVLSIEAPLGALTVAVAPSRDDTGEIRQGTINGQRRLTFVEAGEARFRSNGKDRWLFAAEVPAEVTPAASSAVSAAASAALSARYHVQTADASLPNARVATTSPEIEVSNATPGLVSWVLRAGSVALSKLANLTGLSVLGRAANSSGVMAAITASAADQLLRNNAAGTSLEWGQATTGSYADASVTLPKIQSLPGLAVLCNPNTTSGPVTTLQLGGNCVLGRLGSGTVTTIASSAQNQILLRGSGSLLFAQIQDDSCLARYGSGTLASLAFSALARDGLTYTTAEGFKVGAGTNVTVTADAVNVDDFPLTGLADQADDTFLANISGASAPPTAVALTTLAGDGLTGGENAVLAVGAGTKITVGANAVSWAGLTVQDTGSNVMTDALTVDFGDSTLIGLSATDLGSNVARVQADLLPIAADNLLMNWTTGTAAPTAVPMASFASNSVLWNAAAGQWRRAASSGGDVSRVENGNTYTINDGAVTAQKVDLDDNFAWTGSHEFEETVFLSGVFSPTLTGTTSDLAIGAVNTVKITLTGAQSLTGMVPVADGQLVFLSNVDTTDALTLVHESTSAAANRFRLPAGRDMVVLIGGSVLLRYDGDQSRWVMALPQSEGITVTHSPTTATVRRSLTFTEGSGVDVAMSTSGSGATIDVALDLSEDLAWTGDYTHAGTNTYNGALETFNGNAVFNARGTFNQVMAIGSVFVSTITGTTDNLAIGSVAIARLDMSANRTITGMARTTQGQMVWVMNVSAFTLTLEQNSASSSVGNRFALPGAVNLDILPRTGALLWADTESDFWRALAS